MKVVISHPTGNANVRAILNGLVEKNLLKNFFTTIAYFPGTIWSKLGIKEIEKRGFDVRLKPFTINYPYREVFRILSGKAGFRYINTNEYSYFGIDSVYKSLDKFLCKKLPFIKDADAIYGYEDGSFSSFKEAKRLGLKTFYELPIAYWETSRRLLNEEAARYPEWQTTLGGGITDSEEKLQRKTTELELADLIITPSQFVTDSLPAQTDRSKIIIAPFGTPYGSALITSIDKSQDLNRPLRVLFAGTLTQRKGLADLFKAIKLLNTRHVELVVLGTLMDNLAFYKKELPTFTYEVPRVHHEVLNLMETCDVFCLPSIVEGRALVMQEAMSRGLPLIITPNTGGEDLINDETGFLVPIRSPESIAEKINWFMENRFAVKEMGRSAYNHAVKYTWAKYSTTIIKALELNERCTGKNKKSP